MKPTENDKTSNNLEQHAKRSVLMKIINSVSYLPLAFPIILSLFLYILSPYLNSLGPIFTIGDGYPASWNVVLSYLDLLLIPTLIFFTIKVLANMLVDTFENGKVVKISNLIISVFLPRIVLLIVLWIGLLYFVY